MSESVSYFKTGETITIEAAVNGFVLYTEAGNLVAQRLEDMIAGVINALTNHGHFAAQRKLDGAENDAVLVTDTLTETNDSEAA